MKKRRAIKFVREPDGYHLVILDCGHAVRHGADVVQGKNGARKWYTCSICARIESSQGKLFVGGGQR